MSSRWYGTNETGGDISLQKGAEAYNPKRWTYNRMKNRLLTTISEYEKRQKGFEAPFCAVKKQLGKGERKTGGNRVRKQRILQKHRDLVS